ncbi:MAG: hypothetical protein CMH14_00285 [Mesonia sp.]|nr:hypothetical protein [Mesonia sp.]
MRTTQTFMFSFFIRKKKKQAGRSPPLCLPLRIKSYFDIEVQYDESKRCFLVKTVQIVVLKKHWKIKGMMMLRMIIQKGINGS